MSSSDACVKRRVPLVDALIAYERKGVGVDMTLKTVLGIARLFMIYTKSKERATDLFNVADTIVECRMLCNFGRPSLTALQAYNFAKKRNKMQFWYWLFTLMSFIFRFPEQLSGDFNYLQKTVMHQWSRQRLSFYYRFFKSLSLTCGLLADVCRRRQLLQKKRDAITPLDQCKARDDLLVSNLLMVRSLADMYVYFKWIPQYTPIKTLEYACGALSGLIGVFLVWKDVRFEYASPKVCTARPLDRISPDATIRRENSASCVLGSPDTHRHASPRLGLTDSIKDRFLGDG